MGIPAIAAYPMPTQDELPENTAQWTVDPERAVLLIHDMQKYFLRPFPADESPVTGLVRNVKELRDQCAQLHVPIVYTAQPGDMTSVQRGLLNDFWGPGMSVDPEHRQVVEPVQPTGDDLVLVKWRYSAFHRTELLEFMRRRRRDQLIVCGVYAHVGVLMTTAEAFAFDVQPFLVGDAIADFSLEYHRSALRYAAERCAMVVMTETVVDDLARTRHGKPEPSLGSAHRG